MKTWWIVLIAMMVIGVGLASRFGAKEGVKYLMRDEMPAESLSLRERAEEAEAYIARRDAEFLDCLRRWMGVTDICEMKRRER